MQQSVVGVLGGRSIGAGFVRLWVLGLMATLAACGGGGGGAAAPITQPAGGGGGPPPPSAPALALFAGSLNGAGNVDGTGAVAAFYDPAGVATDTAGNVYVADSLNCTIRKVTPAGMVSTFAGSAGVCNTVDGTGPGANFNVPEGVATDAAGNVYVVETASDTIRKISPAGVVTTLAGTAGQSGLVDGTGAAARFNIPLGIAADAGGTVYVADTYNNCIRKITPAGVVSTLAGSASPGSADGNGAAAGFHQPLGLFVDGAGNVLVADSVNQTIRKVTPAGVVTTVAGTAGIAGSLDGSTNVALFANPYGVTQDAQGNIFVTDNQFGTIRKITPGGVVSTLAGMPGVTGSANGPGNKASFNYLVGITSDAAGNLYVGDFYNDDIRKITPAGVVSTLAGAAGVVGSADGAGAAASFNFTAGVATDSSGNVFVADTSNNTIRKITPSGVVSTFAGTAAAAGSADGTGPAARFGAPFGLATDAAGNVYVADSNNQTIRKITPGGVVSTVAGMVGVNGAQDGPAGTASFGYPQGVAVDGAGNIYVADSNNSTIRKITPGGMVSTLAGTAHLSGSADGTGAAALFSLPYGVATDAAGNVYVADDGNNTIRMITPAGVVTTLAGTAGMLGSVDGTGAAARFNRPYALAVDSAGDVYVADSANNQIRKVSAGGKVTTVAGVAGKSGFVPGPLPGVITYPTGVAVHGTNLYFTSNYGVGVVSKVP